MVVTGRGDARPNETATQTHESASTAGGQMQFSDLIDWHPTTRRAACGKAPMSGTLEKALELPEDALSLSRTEREKVFICRSSVCTTRLSAMITNLDVEALTVKLRVQG
jgi:hypothetical protein